MVLLVNEKGRCLVMITLGVFDNLVLPPMIIFTDVSDKISIQKYNDITKDTALFTQNHLIISTTDLIYFEYLSKYYPNKSRTCL